MRPTKLVFASCIALALAACGGGNDNQKVTMSVAVTSTNANALSSAVTTTPGTAGLTLSDGTNTLVITTAEVVLRDIELKRDDVSGCSVSDREGDATADDDSNDDCEKVSTGPRVVTLPLDGTTSQQLSATVPAGTYDRVEFEIHKLSDDNGSDILRERPDLEDVSVHIEGTFNGTAFVFVSDRSFEQRVDLAPPVVVTADSTDINVTLAIDLGAWFATDAGTLVDPASSADGIEDGIDGTFACFEDENRNGRHDADDDGPDHDAGDDNGGDDQSDDSGRDHPEDN